ncbi:hypothetical protein I551_7226 [Mycobacterium ulcerans str. Harvey]|uniref:Secreted protein n=1 Tax=Mycobacterium ulcerans str. Harvey TaxID=1299332 RepID=A0ABN0QNW3_MYCUL|nr:hypothetical protein I551_7226 [Mycobacterium ulcerans str. Harvey]
MRIRYGEYCDLVFFRLLLWCGGVIRAGFAVLGPCPAKPTIGSAVHRCFPSGSQRSTASKSSLSKSFPGKFTTASLLTLVSSMAKLASRARVGQIEKLPRAYAAARRTHRSCSAE